MGQLPLISVIIPTYNAIDSIHIALESICKQTYDVIEIIVVDYKSTDGTIEFIQHQKDARVKLISSTEKGVIPQ